MLPQSLATHSLLVHLGLKNTFFYLWLAPISSLSLQRPLDSKANSTGLNLSEVQKLVSSFKKYFWLMISQLPTGKPQKLCYIIWQKLVTKRKLQTSSSCWCLRTLDPWVHKSNDVYSSINPWGCPVAHLCKYLDPVTEGFLPLRLHTLIAAVLLIKKADKLT